MKKLVRDWRTDRARPAQAAAQLKFNCAIRLSAVKSDSDRERSDTTHQRDGARNVRDVRGEASRAKPA